MGAALGNLSGLGLFLISDVPGFFLTKGRMILKRNLEKFEQKLENIPPDQILPMRPEIGVPTLQKLTYVEDEDISSMFVNLLANASDKRSRDIAHPSFVHCISTMSSDEAQILLHLYKSEVMVIPFSVIRCQFNENEGIAKSDMLTGLEQELDLIFSDNIPIYIANLTGLGILEREISFLSDEKKYYEPLYQKYEGRRQELFKEGHGGKQFPMIFVKGYYSVTPYGKLFIQSCVKGI